MSDQPYPVDARSTHARSTLPGETPPLFVELRDLGGLVRPWRRAADLRTLGLVVVVAGATDLAFRAGGRGLAGSILVGVTAIGLIVSQRVERPVVRVLALASLPFGAALMWRMSPSLVFLNAVSAAALLALACTFARGGSPLELTAIGAIRRAIADLASSIAAPSFLVDGCRRRWPRRWKMDGRRASSIARALASALPVTIVVAALLASGDALFASLFRFDIEVDGLPEHIFLLVVGAWGMAALLRVASTDAWIDDPRDASPRVARVDAMVLLGPLAVVYAVFTGTQLVALADGGRHVLRTTGLTYAEYARRGFFQLLAAAAITTVVLVIVRRAASVRRVKLLAELLLVLTLVSVLIAVRRLHLYEDAYGLTLLRLYVELASWWIAGFLALFGVWLAGWRADRAWVPTVAASGALLMVLALNVVNPEAIVVRHDVDALTRTGRLDVDYLETLSDDAVPALAESLDVAPDLIRALCAPGRATTEFTGWAAYNWSNARAERWRDRLCA